ncbi:MAG: hypothetical protein KAX49_03990, partial [Halanaerobiales bacterium]|nr:hypothetical protein [Halanaerobiales bacterium]
ATSGTMTGKITRGAVVEHNKTYSHTVSLNDINYVIFGDLRGLPYYGSYTTPSTGWMGEFRVSKYASIEPTSQLGDEESSITYIPPNPINLQNTTGNFWVNYTWEAGSGNVTNDYNVSVNSSWYNTTNTFYNGSGMSPHGWSNISVWAYNSSGMLSTGNLLDNVQIPNNPITITNTSDWNGFETQNVYVDYDAIDVDSDSFTFSCNRTDLFIDFSITTGKGNWTSVEGIYYVDFGVSDEYCSTDNYTMNIVVLDGEAGVPIGLVNTTGNFWVNHTWNTGSNTNTFNVSVNDSWTNDSSNTYYNNTGLIAHGWSNISIAGYNNTIGDLSSFISQNTQIPNNLPVLSGLPDNTTDENINQTDIFDLDDYFTDVDGDNPTYLVESNNQSAYVDVTINASSNVSYTLADDWYGVVEVVINVTDGWNGEDNDTFMIIINAPSGTIPSVSNVTTGSINPTSQWVDWDVNQTAHNRWKYSLYENMSFESWSAWDNSTDIPNITVSTLTEDTKYYYQAWSYNITNILLTDNSTTANFTTQAAVLTFSELIEAGNANESSFGTDTTHHYYRNGTWQIENWINITVNITGTVDAIFAEWKNETCWTNYTMTPLGDYYTVNITDQPTYDYYTFNIWANTTGTVLTKIYIWSYYDYEESWGTIEEWRKYVGLNATAEPFSYEQFYLYNATYNTDQTSDRCLAHEQGTNGTIDDTGLAYYTSPTTSQERQCANFIGYYIDETIKMDNTSVDNIYLHIWWNNSIEQMYLDYDKETSPNLDNGGYEEIQIYSSNSTMKANLPGFEYSTYNLQNIFWDINDVYFENNEINLFALKGVMSAPSIISFINNTHEYKSFFILNLPDNTTLAALDTDSDELNDYVELFEKWTDPKSNDTDGDSVLDNCDADPLDPSNTTNLCNCGYVSGDWIIDEDVVCEDSTVNVDIGNKIILNATLTMVNSIVIMGEFELVPPNKLIIDPNSKFIIRP